MSLPLSKRYAPMEALAATELPTGSKWQYEPKWDGFRCLAFRDSRVELMSKSGKPLTRYFPELVAALSTLTSRRFVLDGEIVAPVGGTISFDHLLMRIHPAASRIQKLSKSTPSMFVVFDLLVNDRGESLVKSPLRLRRTALEHFAKRFLKTNESIRLSPMTEELPVAKRWFHMGVALDGVIAKRRDLAYQSGNRSGMLKIKRQRTADCVVGGFRYLEKKPLVGSLLLGLYDDKGKLDHVGFTSSIQEHNRRALTRKLTRIIAPPGFTGNAPGGPSRWSTKRSTEWQPLKPKLVAEVQFDHFTGGRFRHGTRFLRWRPEKSPRECTRRQVQQENRSVLNLL
jgi:ATP-dependent DNA ligase